MRLILDRAETEAILTRYATHTLGIHVNVAIISESGVELRYEAARNGKKPARGIAYLWRQFVDGFTFKRT